MTSASGAKPGRGDELDGDERARARGGDDEPSMHALRSVWVTMRDEEPPASGLADLLAAARVKASAMRPAATWWERLGAAMRRPAALAVASVALLVGGGVIVGRQLAEAPERMEPRRAAVMAPTMAGSATGPAAEAVADDKARPEPMAAPMREPTTDSKGVDGPEGMDERDGLDGLDRLSKSARPMRYAKGAKPRPPVESVGSAPAESVPVPVTLMGARPTGPAAGGVAKDSPGPRAGVGVAKLDEVMSSGSSGSSGSEIGVTAAGASAKPGASLESPPRTGDAASVDPADVVAAKSTPGSGPASLYRECELAAARGDCGVVRSLVSRIVRTDRGYRARLAKDSPIARCLAIE